MIQAHTQAKDTTMSDDDEEDTLALVNAETKKPQQQQQQQTRPAAAVVATAAAAAGGCEEDEDEEQDTLALLEKLESPPSAPAGGSSGGVNDGIADTTSSSASGMTASGKLCTQWYYLNKAGGNEGPVTPDDLKDLYDEEEVNDDTFVWATHLKEWISLKFIPELIEKMKEQAPEHMIMPDEKNATMTAKKQKRQKGKKGDQQQGGGEDASSRAKRKRKKSPPRAWFDLKKNTSVYVAGIPLDTNAEEVCEVFKKAGVIKMDPVSRQPKIKLYRDSDGKLKGDALVTYLRPESVDLAIKLLDETSFREGILAGGGSSSSSSGGGMMRVQPAKFEQKGQTYVPKDTSAIRNAARKAARAQSSMFGWHEIGDENPRVVILQHMFHPDDFAEEVGLKDELVENIHSELGKYGTTQKVKVFENHPEGVLSVKFADSLVAVECIKKLHGRMYAGNKIIASMWDYKTDYRAEDRKHRPMNTHPKLGEGEGEGEGEGGGEGEGDGDGDGDSASSASTADDDRAHNGGGGGGDHNNNSDDDGEEVEEEDESPPPSSSKRRQRRAAPAHHPTTASSSSSSSSSSRTGSGSVSMTSGADTEAEPKSGSVEAEEEIQCD